MTTSQESAPPSLRMSGPVLALIASLVYTAGMAAIWVFNEESYATDTARLLRASIPGLVLLNLLMFALARWRRVSLNGDRRFRTRLLWIPLIGMAVFVLALVSQIVTHVDAIDWGLLAAVALGTLLVGFGEETAFRGIALTGLAERFPVWAAVVLSSVLFGLLHAVNGLADAQNVPYQVVQTAFVGLVFGWIYVLSGRNLVLVATLHFLWDFVLIGQQAVDADLLGLPASLASIGALGYLLGGLVVVVFGFGKYRGARLSDI